MSSRAPAVAPIVLPELDWKPTKACGSRNGARVRLVVVHRWGVRFTDEHGEALSYEGVIREFTSTANEASAHFVFPGSAVPGKATQMVPYSQKAWTEAYYNPDSVEIESADAIWLGHDPHGMAVLARMVAYLLHRFDLPPRALDAEGVVHGSGFCRHADLGQLGGGHTSCPTTSPALWHAFGSLVQHEHARAGFRAHYGR